MGIIKNKLIKSIKGLKEKNDLWIEERNSEQLILEAEMEKLEKEQEKLLKKYDYLIDYLKNTVK